MNTMTRRALDSKPWYRQTWPWLLMAGPAVVAVAGGVTIWLAVKTSDGLVEDDYYKQGLGVNQRIQRDRQAAALRLSGELMLGDDGRSVRLMLAAQSGLSLPAALDLRVTHPTRPGADQRASLAHLGGGMYEAALAAPIAGRWKITVEDLQAGWRLTGDWNIAQSPVLRLAPGVDAR